MDNLNEELTPKEYFDKIKNLKNKMEKEEIEINYNNLLRMANVYHRTKQTSGLKKILFFLKSLEKEKKVLDAGINIFVYRKDIEEYIENVSDEVVKIIELKNYEREIPFEIIESLEKVQDYFDEFYVVFTDYTGELTKKVEEERREKDPILFGVFRDEETNTFVDRMYFIGDWIDEYCRIDKELLTPKELENKIDNIELTTEGYKWGIKSIFESIKTFSTRK